MSNIREMGKSVKGEKAKRRGVLSRVRLRFSPARTGVCLLIAALCLLSLGCRMDMQDQPRYEAYDAGDVKYGQRGAAARLPIEGTVARGFMREDGLLYRGVADNGAGAAGSGGTQAGGDVNVRGNVAGGLPGANEAAATGGADVYPFPVTLEVLERGKDRYEAFCALCHGMTGDGDGMIPRRGFQRPPSYHEDRLQAGSTPASHFFDVITNGWGAMPAHNYMIPPRDRWMIVAYIRALQLSRRGTAGDVPADRRGELEQGAYIPRPHAGQTRGERGTTNQGTLTPGEVRH